MTQLFWGLGAIVVGLAIFEVSMQPSPGERLELAFIFVMMTLAMIGTSRWLPQLARGYRSIRVTLAVLALAAFSIVVVGAVAVGGRMFFSTHDLTLLLVVIAFGLVSAVGFALFVSKPLTDDLDQLSTRADHVAKGSYGAGGTLDRRDEVGRLGLALDEMIGQLQQAASSRRADEQSRREFFAAIGHDLRTPLASIQAALEAIRDGVAPDPDHLLTTIETDLSALTNLVEDIFLLARIDAGDSLFETGLVDVTELADESVEIMRPLAAARGVELTMSAISRGIAEGAPEPLGRVFRNLIDNAIRHSPAGGAVIVTVAERDGSIVSDVIDQGAGFEPGFRDIAFQRFSRSELSRGRDTGGSGLGLAIARSLVEEMDGEIWIATDRDGGHVGFRLPAATPERPDREDRDRRTSSRLPA